MLFGNQVPGYPSLLAVILLPGGAQLVTLGIIGEYLARVFNEVKGRPLYLVEQFQPSLNHSAIPLTSSLTEVDLPNASVLTR